MRALKGITDEHGAVDRTGLPSFAELYDEFEKPIYNYILRMVRDRETAEDLAQEVFVKVYTNLGKFRGESKLSTWLYRVATNTCKDHFRKKTFKLEKKTDPRLRLFQLLPDENKEAGS